jgi:hypothetical protein
MEKRKAAKRVMTFRRKERAMEPITVRKIARNDKQEIRIVVQKYEGVVRFDVRLWKKVKDAPEFIPTKSGVSVPVELFAEFEQGMRELRATLLEMGLSGTGNKDEAAA